MFSKLAICAFALALLGSGTALGAQPTPVPNNAPDFSSLNFLLGRWQCSQNLPNRPGRTETDTYSMAYDGWQMQDHAVSPPFDKYRTRNAVNDTFITWDPTAKIWVSQIVGNFGDYGLATSPGWVGNTMTWTFSNPDGTQGHSIVTKVSDTKTTFTSWGNTKAGQPQTVQLTGSCTKS